MDRTNVFIILFFLFFLHLFLFLLFLVRQTGKKKKVTVA